MATSWIWRHEMGTQAVSLDAAAQVLTWYDNPGCACSELGMDQKVADFLEKGPRWGDPPPDVLAEIHAALAELELTEAR